MRQMVLGTKHRNLPSKGDKGFSVDVNGDIADNETVNVYVPLSFAMKSTTGGGKEDVTASIAQTKRSWKWNEMDTDATGTITASGLTAGQWNGTFNFNIFLDDITSGGGAEPEKGV